MAGLYHSSGKYELNRKGREKDKPKVESISQIAKSIESRKKY